MDGKILNGESSFRTQWPEPNAPRVFMPRVPSYRMNKSVVYGYCWLWNSFQQKFWTRKLVNCNSSHGCAMWQTTRPCATRTRSNNENAKAVFDISIFDDASVNQNRRVCVPITNTPRFSSVRTTNALDSQYQLRRFVSFRSFSYGTEMGNL